jgi:hypothetical protein
LSDRNDRLKLNPLDKPILGKDARDLVAEMRADEHAARVRDYGPEDAATHEQQVKDGAETPVTELIPAKQDRKTLSSEFKKMLDDAARRHWDNSEEKGPVR